MTKRLTAGLLQTLWYSSTDVNHGVRGNKSHKIWERGRKCKLSPTSSKNTTQSSSKHAISSEKFFFFRGSDLRRTHPLVVPTPRRQPSLLCLSLRPVSQIRADGQLAGNVTAKENVKT